MGSGVVAAAGGRWLTFLGLTVGTGAVVFYYGALMRSDERLNISHAIRLARRAAWLGAWAATVLLVGAGIRLWAQFVAMSDPGQTTAEGRSLVVAIVAHTQFGRIWMASVGLAVLMWLTFQLASRGRRWAWPAIAVVMALLAITPALSGHAMGDSTYRILTIAADALHVAAAGAWLGTLLVFALAAIVPITGPAEPIAHLAALVSAFSPIALVSATTLALTGTYAAWIHLGSLDAILGSDYGRTLVTKLIAVGLVACVGAYNWKRATPRLLSGHAHALRHSARAELTFGALVLLATAILVATPLPGEH